MYDKLTIYTYHFDGRTYLLVQEWPDTVCITKSLVENVYNDRFEIDENIVDFNIDNGIARYYIIKEDWTEKLRIDNGVLYLKKFYGIINPLKLPNGFSIVVS